MRTADKNSQAASDLLSSDGFRQLRTADKSIQSRSDRPGSRGFRVMRTADQKMQSASDLSNSDGFRQMRTADISSQSASVLASSDGFRQMRNVDKSIQSASALLGSHGFRMVGTAYQNRGATPNLPNSHGFRMMRTAEQNRRSTSNLPNSLGSQMMQTADQNIQSVSDLSSSHGLWQLRIAARNTQSASMAGTPHLGQKRKSRQKGAVSLLLRLAFLATLSAGCFSFERQSDVLDPRILAIEAEPPELVLGSVPLQPVSLRALVVDPKKEDREVDFEWRMCVPDLRGVPLGDSDEDFSHTTADGRCDESADTNLLSRGRAALNELSAVLEPPPELALAASAGVVNGLSIHLQVQLRVDFPEGPLYGRKRVVLTSPPVQDYVANQNPRITTLLFDDELWEAGATLKLTLGKCLPSRVRRIVDPDDPTSFQDRCAYRLFPVFDDNDAESYVVSSYSGEIIELQERLRFSWFSSLAIVSTGQTGQPQDLGPQAYDPLSNELFEPATPGIARLWVVARDGRGGTGWEQRIIEFVEP